jgi:tRNA G18 (ribose-2'-O)-methylase SpoU
MSKAKKIYYSNPVNPHNFRDRTRRQRYETKKSNSNDLNLSIATINFSNDENLAFTIRGAACFGVRDIYIIGSVPPRSFLNSRSGSLYDYVNIKSFSRPSTFLRFCRDNEIDLFSLDITDDSRSIYDVEFSAEKKSAIVLGHETMGIPAEILFNSKHIHIPMPGVGYCLNVSQAGTVAMSEFFRKTLTR